MLSRNTLSSSSLGGAIAFDQVSRRRAAGGTSEDLLKGTSSRFRTLTASSRSRLPAPTPMATSSITSARRMARSADTLARARSPTRSSSRRASPTASSDFSALDTILKSTRSSGSSVLRAEARGGGRAIGTDLRTRLGLKPALPTVPASIERAPVERMASAAIASTTAPAPPAPTSSVQRMRELHSSGASTEKYVSPLRKGGAASIAITRMSRGVQPTVSAQTTSLSYLERHASNFKLQSGSAGTGSSVDLGLDATKVTAEDLATDAALMDTVVEVRSARAKGAGARTLTDRDDDSHMPTAAHMPFSERIHADKAAEGLESFRAAKVEQAPPPPTRSQAGGSNLRTRSVFGVDPDDADAGHGAAREWRKGGNTVVAARRMRSPEAVPLSIDPAAEDNGQKPERSASEREWRTGGNVVLAANRVRAKPGHYVAKPAVDPEEADSVLAEAGEYLSPARRTGMTQLL